MSTAWVECWKCDECGHRWIKGEMWPTHCASSKCRKRSWNHKGASYDLSIRTSNSLSGDPGSHRTSVEPEPVQQPVSIEALKAICAGDTVQIGNQTPMTISEVVTLCPKIGYNETDGESYRCCLPKGHKMNCRPGEKVG